MGIVDGTPDLPWAKKFSQLLVLTDVAIIIAVVLSIHLGRFGNVLETFELPTESGFIFIPYFISDIFLAVLWILLLKITGSRSSNVIGGGTREYERVTAATLMTFGVITAIAFSLDASFSRLFVLVALPAGIFLLVLNRWLWRKWLIRKRVLGHYFTAAFLVGPSDEVASLGHELTKRTYAGFRVEGVALTDYSPQHHERIFDTTTALIGSMAEFDDILRASGATTIIVAGTNAQNVGLVSDLSWRLDPRRHSLLVSPGILNVNGPRLRTRQIPGLALIGIEVPSFTGSKRAIKRLGDIAVASFASVIMIPFFLAIAIAIILETGLPILFFQKRIGLDGKPFTMFKFRSMARNASHQHLELSLSDLNMSDGPLFKSKEDPRITRVGLILRKWSLDEFPQLWNVIGGSMSLVGPRPPLASEVELYDKRVHRRFLVKPGITGLWQVSGRSDLTWDESVRLDLHYVENWSAIEDFVILCRTFKAVFRGKGAY